MAVGLRRMAVKEVAVLDDDPAHDQQPDRRSPRPDGTAPAPDRGVTQSALTGLFGRDALFMASWAGQLVIAAVATPFVTRVMPREEFGLVASSTAVMQVLFVLAGAGLATAIQRAYGHGRHADARKLLTVALIVGALVGLLAHVTGPAWSQALGFPGYGPVLWLAVVWAGAGAVTNCSLALLRSEDRLVPFVVVGGVQSLVAAGVSVVLVATLVSPAAQLFLVGMTLAQVAAMTLGIAFALPAVPWFNDRRMVADSLRFSLPLVPAALSTFVLTAGDRLVIQRVLGPDAVGGYQIAYNIGSLPILVLGLLSTAWLPRLFALATERAAVLAASRDAVYRLLVPVILGMAAAGPVVLRIWAPPSYRPDLLVTTLLIVVVSIIPEASSASATRTLVTSGRTATVAVANGSAAAINVALNLFLVPRLGLAGAALATFLSLGALWLALRTAARRALVLDPPPARLLATLWACALLSLVTAIAPVGGPFLVVRLAAGALALVWLLRRVRAITRGPAALPVAGEV